MMTLDTVRQALSSADPYTAMDDIVRTEMASGRRVKEIFDTLYPLSAPALDALGRTPESVEALQGTLDALTGDCNPDQCYEDPLEPVHPVEPTASPAALVRPGVEPVGPAGRVEFARPPESSPALTPPG